MLSKLGFRPESFSRMSGRDDTAFSQSFNKTTTSDRMRSMTHSPLTWGLAAMGLYFGHRLRSEDPASLIPTFTGGILVAIALKRWSNASKREKQRFVKEYNAKMGTTFKIDHPKMQALWDLAHAKQNGVNHLGKYAEHKPVRFQPTDVHQPSGFDRNSVWRRIKSKNVPTSQAIRALGEEWMDRPAPKGIYKERWVPFREGSHHKKALYKYASRTKKFSNRKPNELQILVDTHATNQLNHVALSDTKYPPFRRWYKGSKQTQDISPGVNKLVNRHYRESGKK